MVDKALVDLGIRLSGVVSGLHGTLDMFSAPLWLRYIAGVKDALAAANTELGVVLELQEPLEEAEREKNAGVFENPELLGLSREEAKRAIISAIKEKIDEDPVRFARLQENADVQAVGYLNAALPKVKNELVPSLERLCNVCFAAVYVGTVEVAEGKGFTPTMEEIEIVLEAEHNKAKYTTFLEQLLSSKREKDVDSPSLYEDEQDQQRQDLLKRTFQQARQILDIEKGTIRPTSNYNTGLARVDSDIRSAVTCYMAAFITLAGIRDIAKLVNDYNQLVLVGSIHSEAEGFVTLVSGDSTQPGAEEFGISDRPKQPEVKEGCGRLLPEPIQRWVARRANDSFHKER